MNISFTISYKISVLFFQELLLRLPIHEIAATCYIRDDDKHIVAIKFGNILCVCDSNNLQTGLYI